MSHAAPSTYRPDIDGLRAIAVLLVVLYHAYPRSLPGGFVGVDVFFVISGYLISGILLDEARAGAVSIQRFYERRIMRLFPALIVVLGCALALGWLALLPAQLQELGYQTTASVVFVNNIALWLDVGYFDTAAHQKPLLHLWSLGVEEQFYLLAPLCLAWLSRHKKWLGIALAGAAAASLLCYWNYAQMNPQSAFYLPQARVWELLAGALLAYAQRQGWLLPRAQLTDATNAARRVFVQLFSLSSAAALAVLVGLSFAWAASPKGDAIFSAWPAILAVLCSTVILASPHAGSNRRVLSNNVLVWVGKISYPLYLWHWVLLSFCHVFEGSKPFFETRNPALIASFVLAWLTYRYVERPIRFGVCTAPVPQRVRWLLAGMLVVLAVAITAWATNGVPWRAAAKVQVINQGDLGQLEYRAYIANHFGACPQSGASKKVTEGIVESRCASSQAVGSAAQVTAPRRFLILGDSHAEHLFVGLAETYSQHSFSYATREGLPLLSNAGFAAHFEYLASTPDVHGVVLSASWAYKLRELDHAQAASDLRATLERLARMGKDVYLFDDVPVFPINPERCAYADRLWVTHVCDVPQGEVLQTPLAFAPIAQQLQATYPRIFYIDPVPYFCNNASCSMAKGGKLLYRDSSHLGINGSRGLAQYVRAQYPMVFEAASHR